MPGMNGYQLADAAMKFHENLKVIVLSGKETEGRGFPFLQKPFSQEDLKRTMAQNTGLC
jgi:FixJ family two-component response regulator